MMATYSWLLPSSLEPKMKFPKIACDVEATSARMAERSILNCSVWDTPRVCIGLVPLAAGAYAV